MNFASKFHNNLFRLPCATVSAASRKMGFGDSVPDFAFHPGHAYYTEPLRLELSYTDCVELRVKKI